MYLQSTEEADPGMYSLPCTLFIASVAAVAIAIYKVKTKQHNDHCKNGTNKQYNYNAELAKSQAPHHRQMEGSTKYMYSRVNLIVFQSYGNY